MLTESGKPRSLASRRRLPANRTLLDVIDGRNGLPPEAGMVSTRRRSRAAATLVVAGLATMLVGASLTGCSAQASSGRCLDYISLMPGATPRGRSTAPIVDGR
jgi:hypothetical protein